jgi:hypothetical protein
MRAGINLFVYHLKRAPPAKTKAANVTNTLIKVAFIKFLPLSVYSGKLLFSSYNIFLRNYIMYVFLCMFFLPAHQIIFNNCINPGLMVTILKIILCLPL